MKVYIVLFVFKTLFVACQGTHISVSFHTNVTAVEAGKPFSATCTICQAFVPGQRKFQVFFIKTDGIIALFDLKSEYWFFKISSKISNFFEDDQWHHNQTFFNQPSKNEGVTVVSSSTKTYLPTYEVFITVQKPNFSHVYWCELHFDKEVHKSYYWHNNGALAYTVRLYWTPLILIFLKLSHF